VSRPSGDAPPRLPHGYTNATFAGHRTSSGERTIVKRYLGPDAEERLSKEVRALQVLAGRFPVPPLLEHDHSRIVVGYLAGVPGQELLERKPVPVLQEVGRVARRLHGLDLASDALGALFDGYGIHPPWSQRHSAMLATCAGLLAFARRWSAESAGVWQRRIEATEAFAE
jgi:hypothetical protein